MSLNKIQVHLSVNILTVIESLPGLDVEVGCPGQYLGPEMRLEGATTSVLAVFIQQAVFQVGSQVQKLQAELC